MSILHSLFKEYHMVHPPKGFRNLWTSVVVHHWVQITVAAGCYFTFGYFWLHFERYHLGNYCSHRFSFVYYLGNFDIHHAAGCYHYFERCCYFTNCYDEVEALANDHLCAAANYHY